MDKNNYGAEGSKLKQILIQCETRKSKNELIMHRINEDIALTLRRPD